MSHQWKHTVADFVGECGNESGATVSVSALD